MTITSAADYGFVTGITNGEVVIDGHIMPWRDVYHPSQTTGLTSPLCLRGEDICFLTEAYKRIQIANGDATPSTWAYDKTVSLSNLNSIRTNILSSLSAGPYRLPLNSPITGDTSAYSSSSGIAVAKTAFASKLIDTNNLIAAYDWNDKVLRANNVRKLFYGLQTYTQSLVECSLTSDHGTNAIMEDFVENHGGSDVPTPHPQGDFDSYVIWEHSSSKYYSATWWNARATRFRTSATTYTLTMDSRLPESLFQYYNLDGVLAHYSIEVSQGSRTKYTSNYQQLFTEGFTFSQSGRTVTVPAAQVIDKGRQFMLDTVGDQLFTYGRSLPQPSSIWDEFDGTIYCKVLFYVLRSVPSIDFSSWGWNWTP